MIKPRGQPEKGQIRQDFENSLLNSLFSGNWRAAKAQEMS